MAASQRDIAARRDGRARDGKVARFTGPGPTRHAPAAADATARELQDSEQDGRAPNALWDIMVSPLPGADGRPVRLLAVARDVTAARRAREAAARKAGHDAVLVAVTRAMLEPDRDEADLATLLFDLVAPHLDADVCLAYRRDPPAGDLRLLCGPGPAPAAVNPGYALRLGAPFDGTGAPTDGPDTGAVRAYVSHPLMDADGQLMGTLAIGSTRRERFDEADADLIETLAHVLALAWHRLRTDAARRESEARFRTLADVMPQLIWSARPDGRRDYFNARCSAFTGLTKPP